MDSTPRIDRLKRLAFVLGVIVVGGGWITGGILINTWWAQLWPVLLMLGVLGLTLLYELVMWIWHGETKSLSRWP